MPKSIRDINGKIIEQKWASEFRGFFFGEGYLGIIRNGKMRNGKVYHKARAQITLRDDDLPIIEAIFKRLGGCIHREKRGRKTKFSTGESWSKPYVVWRVSNIPDISRVCDILEDGLLPSKKIREISIVRKFLAIVKLPGPGNYMEKENANSERALLHKEILRLHKYNHQK